ncbi:D-alanine--D-alanine ligase family protein [Actinospica sp.]|jgi:D-alanine-D-alanine ligase|uniref:D-alanine--D-alanine ligase family protein n=1 Tax=Actinospica sp. TaxID=1872142 RepID=UPI002B61643A|nr:D-alanine--D-alanine ligase family protein [Actinospica sp.]HWG22876.1 D-alanine--D-alanine ligase family protein [Actinospica sp.]
MSDESAAPQSKIRVAVVFGGRSSEHAISCVTAGSVLKVLDPERYEVVPVGISTDGRWVLAEGLGEQLAITDGNLPPRIDETSGALVTMAADPTARELTVHEPGTVPKVLGDVDVVLPLLHGPYGEDGTLQGLLELAGIPYVGSGVLASAVGMDKDVMKRLLAASGLPIGPYFALRAKQWDTEEGRARVRAAVAELRYPVFVKPARAGSSMGISKVHDESELAAAIEFAREHDPKLVIEAMLHGREIEVGVLAGRAGGRAEASLPAELKVLGGHEFYDFEAKYLDGTTAVDLPALLSEEQTAEIQRLAVESFEALECEGLARADFFLLEDGRFVVNELNTMPGFTTTSMFPQMWAASGVTYAELVDRLIADALSRPSGLR